MNGIEDKQVDEDSDKAALYVQDKEEKKLEQMQILNEPKTKKILSPEEQFKNWPNYTFFRVFGILFCKIGNTYTCNFDINNNNSPKICIGPHWYLAIVSNILIGVLVFTMSHFLEELKTPFWQKFLYYFFGVCVFFFFNRCALVNPGIVQNKNNDNNDSGFCNNCQVYFEINKNVEHCGMCGVCVENMDHHCVWVGKCVAKNNRFSFYAMIVFIGFIYAYIILLSILKYTSNIRKVKKTKV